MEQAVEAIEMIKPRKAVLTHMGHELDYDILKKQLPKNIVPGFDGMIINIKD